MSNASQNSDNSAFCWAYFITHFTLAGARCRVSKLRISHITRSLFYKKDEVPLYEHFVTEYALRTPQRSPESGDTAINVNVSRCASKNTSLKTNPSFHCLLKHRKRSLPRRQQYSTATKWSRLWINYKSFHSFGRTIFCASRIGLHYTTTYACENEIHKCFSNGNP